MSAESEHGTPAPLGLISFAITTLVVSSINAGIYSSLGVLVPLALVFGGTTQMIAGIFEFIEGDTFAMTAFLGYGGFWWWFGLILLLGNNGLISVGSSTLGFALLVWGLFSFYMWIATFKLNWTLWCIFLTLWITYLCLGLGKLGYGTTALGGWIGLLLGLLAVYGSFAEVVNWTWGRDVVPLGGTPLGEGRD